MTSIADLVTLCNSRKLHRYFMQSQTFSLTLIKHSRQHPIARNIQMNFTASISSNTETENDDGKKAYRLYSECNAQVH